MENFSFFPNILKSRDPGFKCQPCFLPGTWAWQTFSPGNRALARRLLGKLSEKKNSKEHREHSPGSKHGGIQVSALQQGKPLWFESGKSCTVPYIESLAGPWRCRKAVKCRRQGLAKGVGLWGLVSAACPGSSLYSLSFLPELYEHAPTVNGWTALLCLSQ